MTATIALSQVSVPSLKPIAFSPPCNARAFDHSRSRFSCAVISLRIDVVAVATTEGGSEAVKMYGRQARRTASNFG